MISVEVKEPMLELLMLLYVDHAQGRVGKFDIRIIKLNQKIYCNLNKNNYIEDIYS